MAASDWLFVGQDWQQFGAFGTRHVSRRSRVSSDIQSGAAYVKNAIESENDSDQRRIHIDRSKHHDDERDRAGRHTSRADAAEDRQIRDRDLLAEREIDAGQLREE